MADLLQTARAVDDAPKKLNKLKKSEFDLSEGSTNQRTRIASYEAEVPLVLTERAMALAFTVVEEFQTNGTADDTETFNLANDAIQTPNTNDFLLYESGNRVQPDSVDYAADSFDYTDDGTGNFLHAYYVPREATQVEIEVKAPKSHGGVSRTVYDDVTSLLHERNQQKEPPRMSFDAPEGARSDRQQGAQALQRVLPRKWRLDVYQNGPVAFSWTDADEANSQGTTATSALLTMPVARLSQQMPELAAAVRQSIVEG